MHLELTFFFIEKNRHQVKFISTIQPWHTSNLSINCTCLLQALSLSQLSPMFNQKPITCLIRSQVVVKRVKADFLSWQKSLACSLRIFEDNFSLYHHCSEYSLLGSKFSTNLLFATSKYHVTIQRQW